MPTKGVNCACNPDHILSSLKEFISEFFDNFTCTCTCDVYSSAQEDIAICKSLFEAQTTTISQLQAELVLMKTEMAKMCNLMENVHASNFSHRNPSPRRLSRMSQKLAGDNGSQLSNITIRPKVNKQPIAMSSDESSISSDEVKAHSVANIPASRSKTSKLKTSVPKAPLQAKNSARTLKPRKNVVVGSGDPVNNLSAAPSKHFIHLSKVNLQFGKDDVLSYISSKLPALEVSCEELTVRSGTYRGFKLTVDSSLATSLLDPSFGPSRLIVKRFFNPKTHNAHGNFPDTMPPATRD